MAPHCATSPRAPSLGGRTRPPAGAPGGRESRSWSLQRGWGQRGLGVRKEEGEQQRQRPLSSGGPAIPPASRLCRAESACLDSHHPDCPWLGVSVSRAEGDLLYKRPAGPDLDLGP